MNDKMDGQQDPNDAAMPMPAGGGGSPSLEGDEHHHRPEQPAEGADSDEDMDEDMDDDKGGDMGGDQMDGGDAAGSGHTGDKM